MGRLTSVLTRLLGRRARAGSGTAAPAGVRGFFGGAVPGPPKGPRPGAVAPSITYAAEADGEPDPGEVVWGWVPYEDDPSQGKDRPVLLLGRDAGQWVGLMLSSQEHTRNPEKEARHGRVWMDVGTGAWDSQRRESEVRLDRLLRLDDAAIRREGAALDRVTFDRVAARAREFHTFA